MTRHHRGSSPGRTGEVGTACGASRASCTSTWTPSSPPSSNATSPRCAAGRSSSAAPGAAASSPPPPTRPGRTARAARCPPPRRAGSARRAPRSWAAGSPPTGARPTSSWRCCGSCPRWSSRSPSTRPTSTWRRATTTCPCRGSPRWRVDLKARIAVATGGVTGSVGIGTSKSLAKIGSELDKPDGLTVVPPGQRAGRAAPAAGAQPRRRRPGHRRAAGPGQGDDGRRPAPDVADGPHHPGRAGARQRALPAGPGRRRPAGGHRPGGEVGQSRRRPSPATSPTRPGCPRRSTRSPSGSGTRLQRSGTSGRTVTLKVRRYDFTTLTRSLTLPQPVDDSRQIAEVARRLLAAVDRSGGLRLLGVGVSGLSPYAQGDLFAEALDGTRGDDHRGARSPFRPTPPRGRPSSPGTRARTSSTRSTARAGCGAAGSTG